MTVSMRAHEKFLVFLYSTSIFLSMLLFYWSGIYCQIFNCVLSWQLRNRQYAQIFPTCSACLTTIASVFWLLTNSVFLDWQHRHSYGFLEMPTAVGCSLLGGVSAVIEFHSSVDYTYLNWGEKWNLAAIDSTILAFLHAVIAFALN
ncbi:hypothetical protein AB6A40_006817 [Gnathostoma spinigerum]|uniref:Uncharacterized protein n=1 Tax=Gnathostoma spinigerum TaxID=75299 RepID=A0ABD6EJG0_9BILA